MHAIVKARDQKILHQQQKELRLATAMAGSCLDDASPDSVPASPGQLDNPHIYIDDEGVSHNTTERVIKGATFSRCLLCRDRLTVSNRRGGAYKASTDR